MINYTAYCKECGEHLSFPCDSVTHMPNGQMIDGLARIHIRETGHAVIVGYEINAKTVENVDITV